VTWPKYQIFDVFGSYAFTDDVTANFSVENITDEYYFGALSSVGIPSPGRTVRVGLTRTLGEDAIPSVPDLTLGRAAEGTPGSNWTGLYFGGHIGYGFANISGETTNASGVATNVAATESADIDARDLPRGLQAGVNYQFGNRWVAGVEGEFSWSKLHANQRTAISEIPYLADAGWLQAETDHEFEWMASLRGRLGYAFDRFLVYGTGGLAFLDETQERTQYQATGIRTSATSPAPAGSSTIELFKESASSSRMGWTVGGGVEYALTSHWSLKGEYQYSQFGAESFLFPGARSGGTINWRPIEGYTNAPRPAAILGPTIPGSSNTVDGRNASNEVELHTGKVGINYRF
jgi:hemoglobin/transferrin/lactoferrin receptor protein